MNIFDWCQRMSEASVEWVEGVRPICDWEKQAFIDYQAGGEHPHKQILNDFFCP